MTTIVEFDVPVEDSVLGAVFDAHPEIVCEVEQIIASNGHGLWISGPSRLELESALDDDPSVERYTHLGQREQQLLYDVTFAGDNRDVFETIVDCNGTILNATGVAGGWNLRIRVLDREDALITYDRLQSEHGASLLRLQDLSEQHPTAYGLTPKQYETLIAALEYGYFTIPREISMEELAEELEISHQALSERLRRAYRALVVTEIGPGHTEGESAASSA